MNQNAVTYREETPADYRAAENVTREAFWNQYVPGCDEPYLLHILRDTEAFVPELTFVAEAEGQIVGSIAYAKARILTDDGETREVLSFGPIAVLPGWQKHGVGAGLIRRTAARAAELGYPAILIYGDPAYYGRLGFLPAERYQIGTADNQYAAALLAMELSPGALSGLSGRFFEDEAYAVDPEQALAFDATFPEKERRDDDPAQARFRQIVSMRYPR